MNLFRLSTANIRHQPLSTLLTLLLLILGVGTMVVLMLLNAQLKSRLQRDLAGIDLVVGAKGSPLQLILSSVYHVDIPTGNISLADAALVSQHPMVAATIPLALGDTFQGYRIVGTNADYPKHYQAELATGEFWQRPLEAVLGAQVVQGTGLTTNSEFIGSHGVGGKSLLGHTEHPFHVVGILKPTGTALDRLILTSIESVHEIHSHHGGKPTANPPSTAANNPAKEITALLVKFRTPVAAVMLPRQINAQTSMQAAAPAFEVARLLELVGTGIEVIKIVAYILLAIAALSIFIALYSALQKRQFDIAIMRTLGASKGRIFCLILFEGILLSVIGTLLGIMFGHLATYGVAFWLQQTQQVYFGSVTFLAEELYLLLLAILLGTLAALIPAIKAYRTNINTLFTAAE